MSNHTNHQFQPGTLVNCRRRLWRVDHQEGDILYASALNENTNQTKIYLPIETPKQAELEYPSTTQVGRPQDQLLMLNAFRLSMVNSTTPLRSLQYSRAIPMAYQLVPVAMALEQEQVRMLIADDVGLGKTIEAGLIIQELLYRGLAKKLLVICPASLREQWKEALAYFFHIDAQIYSRENRRRLEKNLPAGANLLEFHNAFIISVDYAKATEVKHLLLDTDWDIVVIDEAHQVAKPHQSSADHHVKMDRWGLARDISQSKKIEHLLLLTATPHNGYTDSFASLIHLLDVGAVSGPLHEPTIHPDVARRHIVQRRRSDVIEWLQNDKQTHFPTRDQDELVIKPDTIELDAYQAVQFYGDLILKNARDAKKRIQTLAGWTVLHLHKRALSSPEALRCSLNNRKAALNNRLQDLLDEDPGLSETDAKANVLDEQVSDVYDEDEIVLRSEKVTPGSSLEIEAELTALETLIAKARSITPAKDSKLSSLTKNLLPEMLRLKTKVIIFTKYRDTMLYIAKQLNSFERFTDVEIFTLDGTLNEIQRSEVFEKFGSAPKAALIATDAISEGINLQQYASQVIHYELPWNPNRLEQRNGRVDRFGQKEPEVKIRTLVLDETLDATILKVLIQKSNQIRQDYGFSPPYFGDETSVLDLIKEHGMSIKAGDFQPGLFEAMMSDGELAENPFSEEVLMRITRDSFYGQTDLSLDFIQEQITKTYQSIGSPQAVQTFVHSGLNRFNCALTDNSDGTFKISIQHPDLKLPGLPDLIKSATFDPNKGLENPGTEVLDLGHPLVRRLMDLIKQETFNLEGGSYGRSAGLLTEDVQQMTAVITLLVRFVTHTTPKQIFEDLVSLGVHIYSEDAIAPHKLEALLSAQPAPGFLPPSDVGEALQDLFTRDDLHNLIEDRIQDRQREVIATRKTFRQSLKREIAWLGESDNIEVGSWDILAVNILWPAGGGN